MDLEHNGQHNPTSRILRVGEILERTSLCRSCFDNQIDLQLAPPNIPLSDRARGQHEHVIDAWIASRMALRSQRTRLRDPVTFPTWTPEMAFGDYPPGMPPGMRLLKLSAVEEKVGLNQKNSQSIHIYRVRFTAVSGAPDRIRTCDLWLRRPTLYPTELRARGREGYAAEPPASMTGTGPGRFTARLQPARASRPWVSRGNAPGPPS